MPQSKKLSFLSILPLGDERQFWLLLNRNTGGRVKGEKESKKGKPISSVFPTLDKTDYLDESTMNLPVNYL